MDEQVYVYVDLNGASAFNHGDLQKATRIRQFEETEATAEIARSAWNRKVCAKVLRTGSPRTPRTFI
jgi:hypothetical protein